MENVKIIDVSLRDGLQNDPKIIDLLEKEQLISLLVDAGIKSLEVTSFVHPLKVPQMADASEVMEAVSKYSDIEKIALIPNQVGFQRALKSNLQELNWVSAATEQFNQINIGVSIEENFHQLGRIMHEAKEKEIKINFSLAVSFGCPYEGDVDEDHVVNLVKRAANLGVDRITIADTIGIATPNQVTSLMSKILQEIVDIPIGIHLHDTRGLGLANAYAAYLAGIRLFETAVSGIGGCPFAPGAAGNLATEDLVYLFHRMGVTTGIDFKKLLKAADYAASLSSKNPLGRIRHVEKSIKEEIR